MSWWQKLLLGPVTSRSCRQCQHPLTLPLYAISVWLPLLLALYLIKDIRSLVVMLAIWLPATAISLYLQMRVPLIKAN
jgi:hypothetical protein